MKAGIIGLAGSGKTTVFQALTNSDLGSEHKQETLIGTVHVPDDRLNRLSSMYNPKKTTPAQVEYFLPAGQGQSQEGLQARLNQVRVCDALIQVVRNFTGFGLDKPDPERDFLSLEQELVLADLVVVEKRLERLIKDDQRGKKADPEEITLLEESKSHLEDGKPLRKFPHLANEPKFKGYTFLSAKPMLILFNNDDEDEAEPPISEALREENVQVIRGRLEQELAQMTDEEAADFLSEYGIAESAKDRVIKSSYELLGLISFFTVGEDEVKAWTIRTGTPALEAADVIHSDIKKGFIRAEVVTYDDLMMTGAYNEARKQGLVRLEGKTYPVIDGDVIHFRFNV